MKQKKRSGLIRIAALLLVLLLAVNLVVPCLAADTDYPILSWDDTKTFDTGVLNYDYDKIPDYMLNDSMFLRALAFTGYDVQFLMDQKLLFHPDYVGGNLEKNQSLLREDPILSGIEYNDGGKWGGLTKPATTEKELAATVTGKVPDIPTHLENGMSCTSFIDYFFLAYLPNCEGIDVSAIQKMQTTAGNRIANGTNTYPDLWTEMCEGKNGLIAQGIVKHYEIELSASKVQTAEYNAIWKQIHPGTIIRFGNASSPYVHYAIYVGTYNNLHYIIHVGNDRGPEIIIAETIGSESSAKQSWPIEFYDPLLTENYGSIQVIKTDADTNSKLAGATFMAINTKTGIDYTIGPTNDKGYAIIEELPYGTYTVREIVPPIGYSLNPTVYTVAVNEETPLVTLEVTNDREYGALQILKNTNTGSNKAGWLFNVYKNTPTWSDTLTVANSGQMYRVTVYDKYGNSVMSDPGSMTKIPLKILEQPQDRSAAIGKYARFSVTVQGEGLTYSWQYRNKNTTEWKTSTAGTSRSYQVDMNTSRNGRSVRCVITDRYGNTVISDEAVMVIPGTLVVTKQPVSTTAIIGQPVEFSVTASEENATYQWQYSVNGGGTWVNCTTSNHADCLGATESTLSFTANASYSGRIYRCKVSSGSTTVYTKIYDDNDNLTAPTLTVIPAVITKHPQNQIVALGSTATFSVEVDGQSLTYSWQGSTNGGKTWTELGAGDTFSTTLTEENNGMLVRCVITRDGKSTVSEKAVMAAPGTLAILSQPKSVVGSTGTYATFSVNAQGEDLTYFWETSIDGGNTWTMLTTPINDTPYETDADGRYLISSIQTGNYFVVEVNDGKENWEYDPAPKLITVTANHTATAPATVNFTNKFLIGDLEITKNTEDGLNRDGWKFGVYADEACTIPLAEPQYTSGGKVTFTNLPIGTVWIKELGHANADIEDLYYCEVNPQQIEIVAGTSVSATFVNKLKYGSLEIQKETNTGDRKDGWKIHVKYNDNGKFVEITGSPFTTDSSGYLLIENLLPGEYVVYEEDNGSDYWNCNVTPQNVTVVAGQTAGTVTITNTVYGKLLVKKTTTDGSSVQGYMFNIYDPNGNLITGSPFQTDSNGYIDAGFVLPGMYTVEEILSEDDAYEVVGNIRQTLEVNPENETVFSFVNAPKVGSLIIQKQTNTGSNLGGWKVNVYDSNGNLLAGSPFTTNSEGIITISDLPIGTYTVVEVDDGKDMWVYDLEEKTVTIPHNGNGTVIITNTVYGKLLVKKTTTDNSSVQGYKFNIYGPDGKLLNGSPFTTDSNGYINIGNVLPGMYTVEEILASDDLYEVVGNTRQTLEVKPETETVFTFVNAPKVGTLEIQKVTNTGSNLGGWKVNVYDPNGDLLAGSPFTTDDVDGKITISNLPIGVYTVVEVDDGKEMWVYDLAEKTVTVPHNGTGTVTITNTQLGGGLISKDTNNGGTKAGWQFHVWTDSADYGVFTTGDAGIIDLGLLYPGTYFVQEIGHTSMSAEELSYWTLDAQVKELVVVAGTTKTVTYTNEWVGYGEIIKITNGGMKEGWQFKIWTDTAELGIFTTNSNGEIPLGKLNPGTYYVQEIGHATMTTEELSFWSMDTEIKTLEIAAGETSSITISNVQHGKIELTKRTSDNSSVENWRFDITDSNGNTTTYYTDAQGRISLMLLPGTYKITEVIPADVMYEPQNGADCTVEIVAGEIKVVSYVNDPIKGRLEILKTDDKGNPVSHVGFVAVDSTGNRYSFIESDTTPGLYILSDIPIDTYIITEEVVPPGFQISGDNQWTVTLSKTHRFETLSITNTALGKGKIIKEMSDGSSAAGWVFDIYRVSDNTFIGTFTTGEDGTITTDYLLPGDYRVVERIPEDSIYHPVGGAEKVLTIVGGDTVSVKYVNSLRAGEIIVNKVDGSTDAALAGAKFLLEWLDNDVWTPVIYSETIIPGGCASVGLENGCLVSDENGQIAFYGLHPDCQYRLTEIDAPDGYILQAGAIFEGILPADTLSSTHTVYNHPNFVLPSTGVNNNFRLLEIFAMCLLAAFVLAVGYALNTIRVTRGKENRK